MNKKDAQELDELFSFFNEIQGERGKADLYKIPQPDLTGFEQKLSTPQAHIYNSEQQANLYLGGQGSGKTFIGGGISGKHVFNDPHVRGMICANTYMQLNDSTLFRIREVWKSEFNWIEYDQFKNPDGVYIVGKVPPSSFNTSNHNYDRYNNIISFKNGKVIFFGSLDNYKAIDGKEVAWAILDETKDTRQAAVKEVILGRLRQIGLKDNKGEDFNPLYLLTSPAKTEWLNDWFNLDTHEDQINNSIFSETDFFTIDEENRRVVIASAFHNKKNLSSNFLENQKANLDSNLVDMLIYGHPFAKSGGEFYKGFDRKKHTGKPSYNPELALHVSLDFNVSPYITMTIDQITGKHCSQIDEITLESPRNNTKALCLEFIKRYPGHSSGLFVYGDPSGRRKDTRSEKGHNDYKIVEKELARFKPRFRVAKKAPSIVMLGNFINQILEHNEQGISLLFNAEKCKKTIADFSYLKEAADGTKHKQKETKNGVTYEKYGHTSDAKGYFIAEAFKEEYRNYQRGRQQDKKQKGKAPWKMGKFNKNNRR